MHLGTGLVCGSKILDLVEAGFDFTIFLADWHAWINNKLDGRMENIRLCGEYFKEGFESIGLSSDRIRYRWASDLVQEDGYWKTVVEVAKNTTVPRLTRCLPIMGREMETKDMEAAALLYPCMQAADIFILDVDCACAGVDQRKAHMLARDVAGRIGRRKPTSLHTHLLLGLGGPAEKMGTLFDEDESVNQQISSKMSKSLPKSCIYIHDSPRDIEGKLRDAYCPPRQAVGNPVLEIARYVIFAGTNTLRVERPQKYGGPLEFTGYSQLEAEYAAGRLHPLDLKNTVAAALIKRLDPVRRHFSSKSALVNRIVELEATR
ncbi:MAG: tyrosine--tRNA ligase [Candidatus Bathyarchaeia archaeon]